MQNHGRTILATALALLLAHGTASIAQTRWEGTSGDPGSVVEQVRTEMKSAKAETRLVALVEAAASRAGQKTAEGAPLSPIPAGTSLARVDFPQRNKDGQPQHVAIYLDLPEEFMATSEFTPFRINAIGQEFVHALMDEGVSGYFLYLRDPKTGDYLEPDEIIPPDPPKEWNPPIDTASVEMAKRLGKDPMPDRSKRMPVINPGQPAGSLSGKTIFINQSHGWFDDFTWSGNRWRVQRGHSWGTLEDFDSGEFMNLYVLPMLRNAGAKVMTVRESDHQTNMVIVDNEDAAYTETGTWSNSSISGFRHKSGPSWNGVNINPFNQGAGANRLSPGLTTGAPTATAEWVAAIPKDGYYNVYASWSAYSGRAQDAQYLVHHSGGVSEIYMDQTIDGYTWVLLGNWYFEAGSPEDERKVVLTNHSNDTSAVNVSADAVRWGGGMGDMARHANGISGRPRWEEDAVNYLQFNGFGWSGDLYTGDDDEAGGWSNRSQYARWEHSGKDGGVEDALYFAWHTNAFNGNARGVTTYRHGNASAASETFQYIMHDKLYNAANTLWFTGETWTVRSKNVNNFGENNQNSLGATLPGFLFEGLFHDNEEDSTAYNEPRFRYLYARAIMQGCIDYFNDRDGSSLAYPPEPPVDFRVVVNGSGNAQLNWSAGPSGGFNGGAATSYRVYTSSNGKGFDDGVPVSGTSHTVTSISDTETTYFRVAAVNAGGESFPTETLAVKDGTGSHVLLVNGFDRNQRSLIPTETITNAGTDLRRHVPHTFQAFNYVIEHAEALEPLGLIVSSTSNEPVESGTINLADYDAVIWICGEESTTDQALSSAEQTRLSTYLGTPGARLMISGSEIGWDLFNQGSAADKLFYNNVLRTGFVSDSAGTYGVEGTAGELYAGLSFSFSPASGARYDAEYPDTLSTINDSYAVLNYTGGAIAGLAYVDDPNDPQIKILSFGFPFETIGNQSTRDDFMSKTAGFFGLSESSVPEWMLY